MKEILNRLINQETISKQEAKKVLVKISKGIYNPSQISSFLTVYMMRSISVEELDGFREALLDLCLPIDLSDFDTVDLCGTGGDGKDTFNISTLASFVTAGAGVKVAKHGNNRPRRNQRLPTGRVENPRDLMLAHFNRQAHTRTCKDVVAVLND